MVVLMVLTLEEIEKAVSAAGEAVVVDEEAVGVVEEEAVNPLNNGTPTTGKALHDYG